MSDIDSQFQTATSEAKNLPNRPDDDTMLRLYALYKQATEGDVRGDRPGLFDFVGGAKFDAWKALQGTPQDQAKAQYVALVKSLGGKVGK